MSWTSNYKTLARNELHYLIEEAWRFSAAAALVACPVSSIQFTFKFRGKYREAWIYTEQGDFLAPKCLHQQLRMECAGFREMGVDDGFGRYVIVGGLEYV